MSRPEPKYKKVDSLVHGEVKEIQLIGYDSRFENEIIQIDPKFIKQLKKDSDYTCQACGLKYDKVYGDYSKKKDFIEAHHIEPKFKVKGEVQTNKKMSRSAKDFAMLCANCHRMIHRMMRKEKDRVISLKEFKSKINEKFKENIKNLN